MKFNQKIEKSFSLTDGYKKWRKSRDERRSSRSRNLVNNNTEINTKSNFRCILEDLNEHNCTQSEICHSVSHRNIIREQKNDFCSNAEIICLSESTNGLSEDDNMNYMLGKVPLTLEGEVGNCPLDSRIPASRQCQSYSMGIKRNRRSNKSLFKKIKTRKKVGFTKQISNFKTGIEYLKPSAKTSERNLSANLKSYILSNMKELVDMSSLMKPNVYKEYLALKQGKQEVAQEMNKNIEDVPKILHLQLNLDNRKPNLQVPYSEPQNSEFVSCSLSLEANKDLSKPYLHLPKTKLQSLEFECLSFEVNKDLSPTCGDIYGADEVDNASFDTLVIERDCVHLSDARINSFSKGANVAANQIEMEAPYSDISDYRFNSFASIGKGNHGKFVANDVETEIDACVYSDSASGICCQNEIRGFSKMRKNSNESQSDKLCERNSQTKIVDSYVGQDLGDKSNVEEKLHFERENVKTEFPRIPSLRMISSNLHGTNNNASTSQAYENPWVLQTPSENIPKKFQELPHVEIEIESSLGFDVHHITNVKGNEFPVTGLVRSDSKQSIDSFSSSFHSVGSVQQLYFSDSEAEHNIDQISDDSNEFESDSSSSNMAETQSGHMPKSIGQVLNSSRDIDQVTSASAHMVEVTKDLRDRIQIMNSLNDNVQTTKSLSDSDSDEKQMFPYALAENFESKITARRKKKKLESKSFDEKLNKFHCSPERSTGNKMSKLIKSISLGASEERESKVDKKLTHFRRSLDSSLVQRDILNNIESPDKRKLVISNSTEFLSPVPETDVKIAKKDLHKRDGDHDNNLEPIRYFTLPNPKKLKSQQKLMKKKLSRLGSVSKLLSDKAQSLSNLKVGASFKLRKEIEKSKSLVSSSATSLSDLMTKKASSLSTLIRRRTNSNTIVESPFKQYTKKRNRIKDENKAEFVYEKIIVRVPAKRPVTKLEQKARAKWLCVCLRLAKNASRSEFERFDDETKSRSRSHSYLGRPWSSGSLSSLCTLRSPTMLDEIMKSVDAVRVRQQCSIGKDDMEASDDEDSSSGSSLFLFQKQYSFDTDTKSIKDSAFMAVCRVCGNIRHTSDGSTDSSDSMIARRLSGCYRYSLSLCNLNSTCQCLKQTQNQQYRLGGIVHQIEAETKQDANRRSWDIISDFKWTFPDSIIGDNVLRKSKISLPDYKRPVSMYDLRFVSDTMKDEQVELQTGDAESRDSIDSANALPGTLLRHRPVLDLSGENLDKTIDSEEGVIDGKSDSYTERSQSCGDLIDSERFYENEIRHIDLVNIKVKIEDEEDSYSYHSCSESVEMENDMNSFENEANEKQKSHSCSNLLDTKEVNLGDNLKLDEQIKKELRAMKVKSMSSSHDALNVLVPLETIDTDKIDKCLGPGNNKTDVICGTEVENGQCVMNNLNQWVQNGLNVEGKTDKLENSDNMTTLEFCNKVEQFTINEDDKENFVCEKCNCLRKKRNEVNSMMNLRLRNKESDNVVHEKLCTKPPLPRKNRRHVKVMSLTDISNHGNKDGNNVRDPKRFSMVELDKVNANISICTCENGNYKKDINEHEIKSDTTRTQNTAISGSLRKPVQRFLFDDHQVQSYIKTFTKCDRLKSISSDNVGSVDSPGHSGSHKLYSAQSLNRLSAHSWSDDVFNRLSFPLGPQLSPFADYFASTPVKGYSRFSGLSGITSPGLFQELPELPSLDEECVYKYDICLGYLLYSVQCDNKVICVYSLQRNKQLMESVISPLTEKTPQSARRKSTEHGSKLKPQHKTKLNEIANPAAPITNVPSDRLAHAGLVLRTVLMARAPHMIRDRKFHLRTYRRCMVGTEMVDWLLQQSALVHSRTQAVGMWQALVEEGVVVHVCHEHQFKDKYLFYRFHEDDEGVSTVQSSATKRECEEDLPDVFLMLAHIGPDAMMRMILRKPPHERTTEDLEIIYEELLHIKALSHLSTMVKRELASVLLFESHAKSGTVLFNQGDEGKSWYIILKGSVNVVIYGKGVVCTLHEGDDFGKLALVNDAPRAATIVMRDDNCHFLRVDKEDFNRILRDVEANTVRLKEHGQDVLVLEKIPSNTQSADGSIHAHYKYSVMAGTPEKMLEHLLESRMDNKNQAEIDGFLEDFLLTHVIFMPCNHQCPVLLSHYHSSTADTTEQEGFEFMLNHKKCVLHFVQEWANIVGVAFKEDHTINAFLEELHSCVQDDLQAYPTLKDDLAVLESILHLQSGSPSNKMKKRASGSFTFTRKQISSDCFQDLPKKRKPINPSAETILKIYCADHTYSTLKLPMDTKVEHLLLSTKEKLGLGDDLILCEVKSTGERVIFKENDLCVTTGLSINGQLFVTPKEHLDALTPLPEQEGPSDGSFASIEMYSSREMAYHMTRYDWDLFTCVQEYELIYQVFGRYKFGKITANLDLFLRRFNEIQFWIVTEMVLTCNLSKRVTLLRKFIKLAAHCKEFRNLNSFFAIVMGLSNIAVSRLSQTWEKLPSKFKKMFADFETLMDPSRNHRVYRLFVAKMLPPIIPFMPLLMKDMTFTHEGNKTYFDGLVNFEKMHMIAQTLKTVRFCRSARLDIEAPGTLKSSDTSEYIRSIKVIDNQRVLTQLSHKLEPRKT